MAINWSAYEAAKEIIKGTNKENISDIGGRFPLFANLVAKDGSEALLEILKAVSPKVTARVVESGLKDTDAEEVEEAEDNEEVKEEKEKKETKTGRRGRPAKKKVEEPEEEEDETEEDEDPYKGKSAVELYNMCKKRGIAVKPKLKPSDYVKLLKEDDEAAGEEEDDWGEEEEEEVKKPAKKAATKKGKPSKKKSEPEEDEEEDDEDEWEI